MPQKHPLPPSKRQVLEEFVNDIEVAYGRHHPDAPADPRQVAEALEDEDEGWPDLAFTYVRAKDVLSRFPQRIKRFLRHGEIDIQEVETTDDLLEQAGELLDSASSHEILGGDVLFEGEDGTIFVVTVEAVIDVADPDYVNDVESDQASAT
ncbi:MAG: hypothetical protein KY475_27545 [Planctomycetes bacterium]|nr:hypothetical protein [Planctomycetota bacterium]